MNMQDLILDKRFGRELTQEQIRSFVAGVTDRSIPDYQISAFLMAVVFQGMTEREMTSLTLEMAKSGDICDLSGIPGTKVDKHSSGGVGDKCTLVVLPIVASCGVPVAKLSGRGLGFTGGTIDKLESIKGFQTSIPVSDFVSRIKESGIVLSGQTPELAPADKALYALRDVTGTVQSIPLIASSIMSKKIAGGADAIVLDVTCGSGAFMKDEASARELASAMIKIGAIAGRPVTCVISSMEQPLGRAVGNVLEVQEAIDVLSGGGPADTREVSLTLAAAMLMRSDLGKGKTFLECSQLAEEAIRSGRARATFDRFIRGQDGELHSDGTPVFVEKPVQCATVTAPRAGYISTLDALMIGEASMHLGAGRIKKGDDIDMGAGILLHKKIGDLVSEGELIATLFTGSGSTVGKAGTEDVVTRVQAAISILADPVVPPSEILAILDEQTECISNP